MPVVGVGIEKQKANRLVALLIENQGCKGRGNRK
jgi:hypothetical protein